MALKALPTSELICPALSSRVFRAVLMDTPSFSRASEILFHWAQVGRSAAFPYIRACVRTTPLSFVREGRLRALAAERQV